MEVRDPRKTILDKIQTVRDSQEDRGTVSFPKFQHDSSLYLPASEETREMEFARNLVRVKGKFIYCLNRTELVQALKTLFQEERWKKVFCSESIAGDLIARSGITYTSDYEAVMDNEVAVTGCEYLIARTGSIMVSSAQGSGRRVFGHTPVHIVIGKSSQLVDEISDALTGIKNNYSDMPSQVSLITGPSRTADIEKTLVLGAHGPRDLYVFLLKDR
ncbi:MAG: lactate utilization protein [Bacteroidales bacterium]|nr:lactate utilization protein [Bacteroidales bacterium]